MRRREFVKALGGGVVVAWGAEQPKTPAEIGAWLHIAHDGTVTVFTGKVEMGQNIRTSLAQAVAEELRTPFESVHMLMGDTGPTPYDPGTFSSRTTPTMAPQLRKAAAAAREVLIDLASEKWGVNQTALIAEAGRVTEKSGGRSAAYGELAAGRKLMKTISPDVKLRPAEEWDIAGKSAPKIGGRDYVTGKQVFASDVTRPDMVYARVLRPPCFQARLDSVDSTAAESLTGVRVVRDGDFVGVTAPDSQAALVALGALHAEWKSAPQMSSREFLSRIKDHASPGTADYTSGSVAAGLERAEKRMDAVYTLAFIAHAPMEPRAAVAEWTGGKLTVWTGTTSPFGMRTELAKAFALPEDNVRVIVPAVGSGFCGKSKCEAAVEAARLARAIGKPVKLVWTREEEFTWAWFRPAGLIEVTSSVRGDGRISAWEFHNYNSGTQAIRTPYEIPNQAIYFHTANSPLRQGSYRALAATANFFARETHMDELASALKMDALAFHYRNIKDPRLRAVFQAAAEGFNWGQRKVAPNHGVGIAGGFEKGAYVATCVEVQVEARQVKVTHVLTAFDCGAIINPNHLRNQIEGAAMMGLGGALFESIESENGKIVNPQFSSYRVPRFHDAPVIQSILVNRKDQPSFGAGETPMCAIAPAIGNAIFNATGIRLRSMPFRLI